MNQDNAEKIGQIADSIDSILSAMLLPMPPEFHLRQVRESMITWTGQLKEMYKEETGQNPWLYQERE